MWYAVIAVSFLACSLNPVGIAGLALHIVKARDMYATPLGWAMTAGSFVIAVMGFITTARVAYLERQRRALEFASLATCGAALLAFVLGFTVPVIVVWPIAAVLIAIGALGFRGAAGLPVPGEPAGGIAVAAGAHGRRGTSDANGGATAPPGRKRRRRRRRKRRSAANPPPTGGRD